MIKPEWHRKLGAWSMAPRQWAKEFMKAIPDAESFTSEEEMFEWFSACMVQGGNLRDIERLPSIAIGTDRSG